jgi:hypothetical protein
VAASDWWPSRSTVQLNVAGFMIKKCEDTVLPSGFDDTITVLPSQRKIRNFACDADILSCARAEKD